MKPITLPDGFSPKRLSRGNDPLTSLQAAAQATKASARAILEVASVMLDSQIRIDEEIWAACTSHGYKVSLATVQHARLALSEAGLLVETGGTHKTTFGASSREWIWCGREEEQVA